jgi:hypothetical protein
MPSRNLINVGLQVNLSFLTDLFTALCVLQVLNVDNKTLAIHVTSLNIHGLHMCMFPKKILVTRRAQAESYFTSSRYRFGPRLQQLPA